jgi:hypothetical protein
MSDATTALLGDLRPLDELAQEMRYKSLPAFRRWLCTLGVPIVAIRRVPHARPADIQAALAHQADARSVMPTRGPGRPRNTPQKAYL